MTVSKGNNGCNIGIQRNKENMNSLLLKNMEKSGEELMIRVETDVKAASHKAKRDSNNRGNRRDLVITEF